MSNIEQFFDGITKNTQFYNVIENELTTRGDHFIGVATVARI